MPKNPIPKKWQRAISKLKPAEKDLILYHTLSNKYTRVMLELSIALQQAKVKPATGNP